MTEPYRYKEKEKSLLKSVFDWFFNNDFGLGPAVDTNGQYPHIHSWEFYNTIRCGWRIEEGLPVGERIHINLAILDVEKYPSKNETKVSQLRNWQKAGYEYVHTSQTVYRCKVHNCGVTKNVDVYTAPVKGDGSGPMVVDLGSRFQKKFVETSRIPVASNNVNNRKEIAVEPMKRYGVKYKPVRPAPIVPMED